MTRSKNLGGTWRRVPVVWVGYMQFLSTCCTVYSADRYMPLSAPIEIEAVPSDRSAPRTLTEQVPRKRGRDRSDWSIEDIA
jgi:hypothetical protein